MYLEKEGEANTSLNKKHSEVEFFTPKSNLAHECLTRNVALDNLHTYVNTKITDDQLKKRKGHSKSSAPAVIKKNFPSKQKNKACSILNYINGFNNTRNIFFGKAATDGAKRKGHVAPRGGSIRKLKEKISDVKKNKSVKKRIFSESTTNILWYFRNVDINNKEKTDLPTHCGTDQNAHNSLDDKTFKDSNGRIYAHGNGENHADVDNNIYYGENNVHSGEGGNLKRVWSEDYENKMTSEGKVKYQYVQNNAKLDCNYEEYLQTAYLYCKKYFLYRKMECFSKYLFYRKKTIKNFIFLIEALFLRKKYIDLLDMLQRYRRLWMFSYKGVKTKQEAELKNNARNKIEKGDISTKGSNSECGKNFNKLISHKYIKNTFFKVAVQNAPTALAGEMRKVEHSNICNIEHREVHKFKKQKKEKMHTHKMYNTQLLCKHRNNYELNNAIGGVINDGKICKKKTCNKIYCICYVAFVKIMSLIRMQNQNCLNRGVNFTQKISKKCLLNKNGHYLTHAVIHLYELAGLYNYSLKYSMILFLKCPVYPQIILKLFSFSILSLKDEIYLILLAKYCKSISWMKYFFLFILYSVNYQFRNKKIVSNFLFLLNRVTKGGKNIAKLAKKNNFAREICTKKGGENCTKNTHDEYTPGAKNSLCGFTPDEHSEKTHNRKSGYNGMGEQIEHKQSIQTRKVPMQRIWQLTYDIERNDRGECKDGSEYAGGEKRRHVNIPQYLKRCSSNQNMYRHEANRNEHFCRKITLYSSLYSKVTLYDAYVYIAQNKFSDYFPKIFLYSKLHIIINIKRSSYEQNFPMCYSLSKLLLMDHMYDSSVVAFFVNSAYLLKKVSAIKRLAQELKRNNQRICFLFCNAALLLHFKQIERSIQIYKYIVDSYQNIFSDLYFYSLFNLIYALQLTQKAHQIVIFCKNLNKLFFNNINSYILLSYYYFVNDIPTKCYASLRRAHDIYPYHPDTFYLLSLLALQAKRYEEYGAFSELALFFSLRNGNLRNYVFSNIYGKQHKHVPSYLLSYHLEIIDSDTSTTLGILNLSSLLNYVYFEGLIKCYIILHFCSAKRSHINYLMLSKNLGIMAAEFFPHNLSLLHSKWKRAIVKNEKVLKYIDDARRRDKKREEKEKKPKFCINNAY
ncbi:hypothetical protein C922_00672 [Plasmodium inui San Antonio 1]|uniref:Uncharacterized protein n=1 Tax=Plasmodium inui San Antonio 1 TaxID=1237626 RepID=W7AU83_9APIC|nr:hypothetical protein C922_00672 [Plasmodium inui San Antonio 1]EUD68981.1 hypothetical protein C922_00672 [Plasmodium inui San Antonio 1]